MRAYVRRSIKEQIEFAARLNKATPGEVIENQFREQTLPFQKPITRPAKERPMIVDGEEVI